ncbi:hypothetical protein ACFQ0N_26980 [Paenibacillus sp. GCM10027626]
MMMNDSALYAPEWGQLSQSEKKERIDALLAKLKIPFTLSDIRTFSSNGITTETVLLVHEGRQFVFVPGRQRVTLGWNNGIDGLDENALDDIRCSFDSVLDPLKLWRRELEMAEAADDGEQVAFIRNQMAKLKKNPPNEMSEDVKQFYSFPGIVSYINENTSPVRTVDIAPMIVECDLNEVGLVHIGKVNRQTNEHDLSPEDFDKVKEYIFTFDTRNTSEVQEVGRCRFVLFDEERLIYDVFVFRKQSNEELMATIHEQGFSLPTEDQWEYLCGGGSRTLFPFGNRFDEHKRYAYMTEDGENVLENPNMFGLIIAYDPYKYETVDADCLVKGGDGGGALCGGEPFIYIMLPLSTYWRDTPTYILEGDQNLSGGYFFYRRIITLEG